MHLIALTSISHLTTNDRGGAEADFRDYPSDTAVLQGFVKLIFGVICQDINLSQ